MNSITLDKFTGDSSVHPQTWWGKFQKWIDLYEVPNDKVKIDKSNMRSLSVNAFKNAALNLCKIFVISGARVAYQIAASSDN
jgi:hypothetical protein